MPRSARIILLLLGILLVAVAPLHAQGGLQVLDPSDITIFIENGEASATATLYISNEGGALTGSLRISTFLQASSPPDFATSPVCLSLYASDCLPSLNANITFPPGITALPLTITAAKSSLQYGEATLVVLFDQDSTPDDGTVVADPLTLAEYRKVFFVPSLYVQDVMITALEFALAIVALALLYFFIKERPPLYKGLQHPLGEMTWGTQSWTAFLTALVSTVSVVTLSGNSAGISVSAFNANVYAPSLTVLGILFSVLPVLAVIVYRLLGRWSNNTDPKGGNLIGYIVGSAAIVFALVGSVLISANVIQMLILSSLGVSDPPLIPYYLGSVTVASGVLIVLIGIYFCFTFRGDLASQLRAQRQQTEKAATEAVLLGIIQQSWDLDKVEAIPALLALQVLPDYDLGILPPPDDEPRRGMTESYHAPAPQPFAKPDTRSSPKMRI